MPRDLQPDSVWRGELALDGDELNHRRMALMGTLDKLNDRFGRGTLMLASEGAAGDKRDWAMRQALRTPHYTTDWNDMPGARAVDGKALATRWRQLGQQLYNSRRCTADLGLDATSKTNVQLSKHGSSLAISQKP